MWWLIACSAGNDPTSPNIVEPSPTETGATPSEAAPPTGETGTLTETGTKPVGPQSVLQFDGPAPTNLVIISLDTTRRDYVGRYGKNGNTPNLDRILAEGVALDQHRSCSSWTAPSMTCVTTGFDPFALDWWPWSGDERVSGFDPDVPTLARMLRFQNGMYTSLVTSNPIFGPIFNLDAGFDETRVLDWAARWGHHRQRVGGGPGGAGPNRSVLSPHPLHRSSRHVLPACRVCGCG